MSGGSGGSGGGTSGGPPSPSPQSPSPPTPTPIPTPAPPPGEAGTASIGPDPLNAALTLQAEDEVLVDNSVLPTAMPVGLVNSDNQPAEPWSAGGQDGNPYAGVTTNGALAAFAGQDIDAYSGGPPTPEASNAYVGGQSIDPYSGTQAFASFAGPVDQDNSATTVGQPANNQVSVEAPDTATSSQQVPVGTVDTNPNSRTYMMVENSDGTYTDTRDGSVWGWSVRQAPAPPGEVGETVVGENWVQFSPPTTPPPAAPDNPPPAPTDGATVSPSTAPNGVGFAPLSEIPEFKPSAFDRWVIGPHSPVVDYLINDRNLEAAQNAFLGMSAVASVIASGGLLLEAAPGVVGIGSTSAAASTSASLSAPAVVTTVAGVAAANPQLVEQATEELETLGPSLTSELPAVTAELPAVIDKVEAVLPAVEEESQVTIEYLGESAIPRTDTRWAQYQISATGGDMEGVFKITEQGAERLRYADAPPTEGFLVDAKESIGRMWTDGGEQVVKQAADYLRIADTLDYRGVRYAMQSATDAANLYQRFALEFPAAISSGQLQIWVVPYATEGAAAYRYVP
ncbi:MAG: hypothetical protein WCE30_23820 [Mycobacterium sp.]